MRTMGLREQGSSQNTDLSLPSGASQRQQGSSQARNARGQNPSPSLMREPSPSAQACERVARPLTQHNSDNLHHSLNATLTSSMCRQEAK